MTEAQAWTILDIAGTRDQVEIKRAYSRRLKAIDPDSDPQAFINLREARDLVMYLAQQEEAPEAPAPVMAPAEPIDEPVAPLRVTVEDAPPETEAETTDSAADGRIDPALFATIEQILYADQEAPVDDVALAQATHNLLAHPGMDRIDTAGAVEGWLAGTIVNGRPRSDAMLDPAIARFGWDNIADDWRRPQALDIILQRRSDREFENYLTDEQPRYRRLFEMLRSKGRPSLLTRWRHTADVWALFAYAWRRHPTTIESFHPDAMAYWEKRIFEAGSLRGWFDRWWQAKRGDDDWQRLFGGRRNLWRGILLFILIMSVLSVLFGQPRHPRRATTPAPMVSTDPVQNPYGYNTSEVDLTRVLQHWLGNELNSARLAAINPALHRTFIELWNQSRQQEQPFEDFDLAVGQRLEAAYRSGVRGGDHDLLADYWWLEVNRLKWLRNGPGGDNSCADYLRGYMASVPRFSDWFIERDRALHIRALAVAQPRQRARGDGRYTIPDAVARSAMQATGLSLDRLQVALDGRSTPLARCNARIAILEGALAQPPEQGTAFLRTMMR